MSICLASALLLAACSKEAEPPAPSGVAPDAPDSAAGMETEIPNPMVGSSRFDLIAEYDAQCDADEEPSLECEWLRGLIVADVVEALEAIQESSDQRGVEEALAALDIEDEPEVIVAASRVLGRFPETPGVSEKLTPLLFGSPYLEVRRAAARLLGGNPDAGLAVMAQQWSTNHGVLYAEDVYAEFPAFPPHYAAVGFPVYPGAEWYTPADSDRSVGWSSADPPSVVVERLSEILGVQPIDYQQWIARAQQEMVSTFQASFDQSKVEAIQKLTEEYLRTQNVELFTRIEKLQAEMSAPLEQAESNEKKTMTAVLTPPDFSRPEQIFYFVAEEKAGHVARAILVYPQAGINRTVIQTGWDLRDYPPAWPVE